MKNRILNYTAFLGCVAIFIAGCCDKPEIYTLTSDPKQIFVGKPAAFSSYVDETGNCNCEYTWNFGDGSPEDVGMHVSHTYTNSGSFSVKLKVKNGKGSKKEDQFEQVFTVYKSHSNVIFWTQDTTYGDIVVKLGNFGSRKIDTNYLVFPGCKVNARSAYFQNIPSGVFGYTATAKNFATWIGTVNLTIDTCNNVVLN